MKFTQLALEEMSTNSEAIALFATALEAFSKLGIDNLTVPVGSAALCFYLNQLT